MSNRKVVVLRDFSYAERWGEEELAIDRFLQAAPEHVSIEVLPPGVEPEGGPHVVISFGVKRYPDRILEWLLQHPRHIHVSQDWWEAAQPQSKWRNKIVEEAAATIFMSPMHRERYERVHQVKSPNSHVIPFPMLESDWDDWDDVFDKKDAVLWCAPWHPDAGNDLMLQWAARKGEQVHAYGLTVPTEQLTPAVKGCGPIELGNAAPTFLAYKRFAYFPRMPVPFGFTFLLAYMLGLEVTYSGELGCLSYGPIQTVGGTKKGGLPDFCRNAPRMFWDVVEEVAA